MKKIKIVLFAYCILLVSVLMFTACDENSTEETFSTTNSTTVNNTITEAHAHSFGEWEIVEKATCTVVGSQARYCTCGEKQTKSIPTVAHNFGEWVTTKTATCTEGGEEKRTCACNKSESRMLPASHSYIDNVCTQCGSYKPSEGLDFEKIGEEYAVAGLGDCTDKHIVIPSTYNGCPVTKIDSCYYPFALTDIVSIIIPDSVTEIGYHAFYNCEKLERVVLGKNVSVIDDGAFGRCFNISEINFPENLTVIGDSAFSECSSIESIVIPAGVKKIGNRAFYKCTALSEIEISNGIKEIGSQAFSDCRMLKTVVLPNSVNIINDLAFYGCVRLHTIYFGSGVTDIGSVVFTDCDNLKNIYYNGSEDDWKLIINQDRTLSNATIIYNTIQPKAEDVT